MGVGSGPGGGTLVDWRAAGGCSRGRVLAPGSTMIGPLGWPAMAGGRAVPSPRSETVPAATATSVGIDVRATRIALIRSGLLLGWLIR
jgi:hypothetical protein